MPKSKSVTKLTVFDGPDYTRNRVREILDSPKFTELGFSILCASSVSLLVFEISDPSEANPSGLIHLDLPIRNGSHCRDIYLLLHNQPCLLRRLLAQHVTPRVLKNFLDNVEGLSDTINTFIDCVSWFQYAEKYQHTSIYGEWWMSVTQPVISLATDMETFSVLEQYGADLSVTDGFSDSQCRVLLADFIGEVPQLDLQALRRQLAENSVYRKLTGMPKAEKSVYRKLTGGPKREEQVLFWDADNQAVRLREEKEISITLKESVSRDDLVQANPDLRILNELSMVNKAELGQVHWLDYFLTFTVYDTSYNPANGYLTIWFCVNLYVGDHPEIREVPVRLPFSFTGENVIASVTHQRITVTDPLKMALFFLHGYEYLSHQRPYQLVHHAARRQRYPILRYLIGQGADLFAADPASSLQPAIIVMLGVAPPDEIKFYLDKVSHRATEFFSLCLQSQHYSTARKVLMKTRQSMPLAALCDTKLLHVERLLMTEAKDPVRELDVGSSTSAASPTVVLAKLLPDTERCTLSYKTFRLMLQCCPELVVALIARRAHVVEFDEKMTFFLEEAIKQSDEMMLEFLIGPEVGLGWPAILPPEKMKALSMVCDRKKALRKLAGHCFAEWYKKSSLSQDKEVLPAPVLVSPEVCQALQQELSDCLALCQRGWQAWCRQHKGLPNSGSITGEGAVGALSEDIDKQSFAAFIAFLAVWKKQRPYVSMSFFAWYAWLESGRKWLELIRLLQKQMAAMSLGCVREEAYQNSVKAQKRYQQRIQDIEKDCAQARTVFQDLAEKQRQSVQSEKPDGQLLNTDAVADEATCGDLASSQGDKGKRSGPRLKADSQVGLSATGQTQEPAKTRNKKTYIRLLQAFFLTELPYVPSSMYPMAINRFLVLLKDIQDRYQSENAKLVVCHRVLPTLRNMYVHAGYFLSAEVVDTLMASLRSIGELLDKEEASLGDIKQSVYHFLCQAYTLALDSWGQTDYAADLQNNGLHDKRKAELYALYAQRPIADRVARCRQIVLDRSCALPGQEDSSRENQVAWLYAMVEIGEHCKADVFKFLQSCGQPHINRSLRTFQLLRGELYHTFLPEVIPEGDDPIVSNILEKTGALDHSDAVVDLFVHVSEDVVALGGDVAPASDVSSLSTSLAQHAFFQNQDVYESDKVSSQLPR